MSWHTQEVDEKTILIMDGPLVVGSMVWSDWKWNVEIMAFGADIKFEGVEYESALAFVEGVDKTFETLKDLLTPKESPPR